MSHYHQVLAQLKKKQQKKKRPSRPRRKRLKDPIKRCIIPKKVAAKIRAVTFRSDHLDNNGRKLLRPSSQIVIRSYDIGVGGHPKILTSVYGEAKYRFKKPEWHITRSGNTDCHPISHTKNRTVKVDVEIEVTVSPIGQTTRITEIVGAPTKKCPELYFKKTKLNIITKTNRIIIKNIPSGMPLFNGVCCYKDRSIKWWIRADDKWIQIGTTGKHTIYVTLAKPYGKMDKDLLEKGRVQDITVDRLWSAIDMAYGKGKNNEKECVDAIFKKLRANYFLGRRWKPIGNQTGVKPKPSLHHYLWLCNAVQARGECHNIAAGFALACRILGVKKPFEIGHMFPMPGRKDNHPHYHRRPGYNQGEYDAKFNPYERPHPELHSGGNWSEQLVFLDGRAGVNNFEGVARYANALYAIGDCRFDLYNDPHKNASTYFMVRTFPAGESTQVLDRTRGTMQLAFVCERFINGKWVVIGRCRYPYGNKVDAKRKAGTVAISEAHKWQYTFKWED